MYTGQESLSPSLPPSSQLKAGRAHLLGLISKQTSSIDEVTVAFTEYLSLLRGLVEAPEGGESKLRGLVSFKWTNSLGGRTPRYKENNLSFKWTLYSVKFVLIMIV
jgi:hypothetical protein